MHEKYYWVNEKTKKFLERGYLNEGQTPQERVEEIALTAEKLLNMKGFAHKFEEYMSYGWYSLASPIWSNFGNKKGSPISCNGSLVSDDMFSILGKAAETGSMTKLGAGTSAYFGKLRPRGSSISTGGKASGPVHYMELYDVVTNIVSQSNVRRGFFAAYLDIDHPDIEEFLKIKSEGNRIQNISIGVCISDKFMNEMIDGDKVKRKIWTKVIQKRFETGYPYLFFTDTVNNNKPQVYKDKHSNIYASNLCVAGDQRVVSDKGLLTAKELYDLGEELVLFDNDKQVKASKMKLIKKNADVYKITLENGMSHKVTNDHKVVVKDRGDVEFKDLKLGDYIAFQTGKGIFGEIDKPEEAYSVGQENKNDIPDWIWCATKNTQLKYFDGLYPSSFTISPNKKFLEDLQIILANLGLNMAIKSDEEGWVLVNNTKKFHKIKVLEYIGKEDVYCCKVDSEAQHFICNGFITHNCEEINLPASENESFVCCLSSLNLLHYDDWKNTDAVEILTYFLDAVMSEYIEKIEHIPFMQDAHRFAKRHRALGIGVLGWHSYLQSKMISFESMKAKLLNVEIFKLIQERTYQASKEMAELYGEPEILKGYGMRNTTTMAVAPTTSSSFILGQVSPSFEPLNSNYFVKDLEKGKFTYKNPYLKEVLINHKQDTKEIWNNILVKGGSVQHLNFLTQEEKDVFKTFGEISQKEIVIQASARQKYIDQGQSLNLMVHPDTSPKEVSELLIEGWRLGLKGFYYQRGTNPAQELGRSILSCNSCEA